MDGNGCKASFMIRVSLAKSSNMGRRPSMAAAQSTKKANPEKENHHKDTYYEAPRGACHEVSKKCVCFHSVTKSTPKTFHSTASFYSQFYKTILPFFYDKAEMQKIPGSHSWRRSNYPKSPIAKPYRIAMIPHMKPIKVHTTKYAKNGSSIMRNQNRSQNRRHGLFFIAWTPFIPNFMKPFYHFFAASQETEVKPYA